MAYERRRDRAVWCDVYPCPCTFLPVKRGETRPPIKVSRWRSSSHRFCMGAARPGLAWPECVACLGFALLALALPLFYFLVIPLSLPHELSYLFPSSLFPPLSLIVLGSNLSSRLTPSPVAHDDVRCHSHHHFVFRLPLFLLRGCLSVLVPVTRLLAPPLQPPSSSPRPPPLLSSVSVGRPPSAPQP